MAQPTSHTQYSGVGRSGSGIEANFQADRHQKRTEQLKEVYLIQCRGYNIVVSGTSNITTPNCTTTGPLPVPPYF